jgi:hypothetical protein
MDPNQVRVVFTEAVDKESAETKGNYSIDKSVTVNGAVLQSGNKTVVLTTSTLTANTTYTLTVNNVKDLWDNIVPANTKKSFTYTDSDPDLVGYWPFDDGTATDVSGSGNNGTVISATSAAGKIGNALSFDGTDDYVNLPTTLMSGIADMTFCAWVKWGGGNNWQYIWGVNDGIKGGDLIMLTPKSGDTGSLVFVIRSDTSGQLQPSGTSKQGSWEHVAVVLEGDQGRIYRDGNLAGSGTVTVNPADLTGVTRVALGHQMYSGNPFFKGEIDEVYLYKRALTSTEIGEVMGAQSINREVNYSREILNDLLPFCNPLNKTGIERLLSYDGSLKLFDLNGKEISGGNILKSGTYILRYNSTVVGKIIFLE